MATDGLSPYILELVEQGTLLPNYARAVAAYVGDRATIAPRGGEERSRGECPEHDGYSEGAGKAADRVRRAKEAMGRARSSVMYFIGVRGVSFAEAAVDLGYASLFDVRREFLYAAGNLTEVYREFRYQPRRKGRAA